MTGGRRQIIVGRKIHVLLGRKPHGFIAVLGWEDAKICRGSKWSAEDGKQEAQARKRSPKAHSGNLSAPKPQLGVGVGFSFRKLIQAAKERQQELSERLPQTQGQPGLQGKILCMNK